MKGCKYKGCIGSTLGLEAGSEAGGDGGRAARLRHGQGCETNSGIWANCPVSSDSIPSGGGQGDQGIQPFRFIPDSKLILKGLAVSAEKYPLLGL